MEFGYIFAGFVVGWLVGLTGVGGGSLMTPILMMLFSIKPAVAVGTDLLYASVTKLQAFLRMASWVTLIGKLSPALA